ncbi:hypothetical protein SAMN02910409_0671 [Prevotellaceae bacterium HUN156]|nr:hypothetical protein SAMN02910409_0671 [Prevotellaceae bacterium HUN156]
MPYSMTKRRYAKVQMHFSVSHIRIISLLKRSYNPYPLFFTSPNILLLPIYRVLSE